MHPVGHYIPAIFIQHNAFMTNTVCMTINITIKLISIMSIQSLASIEKKIDVILNAQIIQRKATDELELAPKTRLWIGLQHDLRRILGSESYENIMSANTVPINIYGLETCTFNSPQNMSSEIKYSTDGSGKTYSKMNIVLQDAWEEDNTPIHATFKFFSSPRTIYILKYR